MDRLYSVDIFLKYVELQKKVLVAGRQAKRQNASQSSTARLRQATVQLPTSN